MSVKGKRKFIHAYDRGPILKKQQRVEKEKCRKRARQWNAS